MFKHFMKQVTKLELSGIALPAGSDLYIKSTVKPISQAADIRRSVNGDLHNVAREVFQKFAVSISCSDMRPAAFSNLFPGQYIEVIAPEPHILSLHTPSNSAILLRSSVDIVGVTADGDVIQPSSSHADPRPLQVDRNPARVTYLRSSQNVIFPVDVVTVRYRPILACMLLDWSQDSTEHKSSSSWSMQLEEV